MSEIGGFSPVLYWVVSIPEKYLPENRGHKNPEISFFRTGISSFPVENCEDIPE